MTRVIVSDTLAGHAVMEALRNAGVEAVCRIEACDRDEVFIGEPIEMPRVFVSPPLRNDRPYLKRKKGRS